MDHACLMCFASMPRQGCCMSNQPCCMGEPVGAPWLLRSWLKRHMADTDSSRDTCFKRHMAHTHVKRHRADSHAAANQAPVGLSLRALPLISVLCLPLVPHTWPLHLACVCPWVLVARIQRRATRREEPWSQSAHREAPGRERVRNDLEVREW